jgi:hypothetical protein
VSSRSKLDVVADSTPLKFVLATAPWTGGISFLLSERAQNRRYERIESFIVELGEKMVVMERRGELDASIAQSDEFLTAFEWALDEVTRSDDQ